MWNRRCLLCLASRCSGYSRSILLHHCTELLGGGILIIQIEAIRWAGLAHLVESMITHFVFLLSRILILLYLGLLVGGFGVARLQHRFRHWILWRGRTSDFVWRIYIFWTIRLWRCLVLRGTLVMVLALMPWCCLWVWRCHACTQLPSRLILADSRLVEKPWHLLVHLLCIRRLWN